jgi:hypothetical protein
MVNRNNEANLLRAKREELLDQLKAVDKALAALGGSGGAVPPTRVKAPRTLSDEHKHALNEGRRKARHAKDAAAGFARELPDLLPGLTPASSAAGREPRLVKRRKA